MNATFSLAEQSCSYYERFYQFECVWRLVSSGLRRMRCGNDGLSANMLTEELVFDVG